MPPAQPWTMLVSAHHRSIFVVEARVKILFLIALAFAAIVAAVLKRRPALLKAVSAREPGTKVERVRVYVAQRPLLWFVVLGAVPSFVLGVLGEVLHVNFYPLGMAALAALTVAWACDARPHDPARPRLRLALSIGIAALYLAMDLTDVVLAVLVDGSESSLVTHEIGEVMRLDLIPALVIGWVLSGAVSPTAAIRTLVCRLWTAGPRRLMATALLAWPLATVAMMFVFGVSGIADLQSTRVDPFADAFTSGGPPPGIVADLFSNGTLGELGIWSVDDLRGVFWLLRTLAASTLLTAPIVLAWYGFAAPRLLWRMSPLLTAVSLSLLMSLDYLWMLVPPASDALFADWTVGGSVQAAVYAGALVLAVPLAAASAATAVWLVDERPGTLLPVVLLAGVAPSLSELIAYSWVDWDRFWVTLVAMDLAQIGVGAVLIYAAQMWRRPGVAASVDAPVEAPVATVGADD